jgi:hypothetical protein
MALLVHTSSAAYRDHLMENQEAAWNALSRREVHDIVRTALAMLQHSFKGLVAVYTACPRAILVAQREGDQYTVRVMDSMFLFLFHPEDSDHARVLYFDTADDFITHLDWWEARIVQVNLMVADLHSAIPARSMRPRTAPATATDMSGLLTAPMYIGESGWFRECSWMWGNTVPMHGRNEDEPLLLVSKYASEFVARRIAAHRIGRFILKCGFDDPTYARARRFRMSLHSAMLT